MYGTQTVNRGAVQPGMLVVYQGRTWRASANTGGKLYLHTLYEARPVRDALVEIVLNKYGHPELAR